MNRWIARLLALVLAAAAVYLVYANIHAGSLLLESTLAAAALAIATVLLVWKRPVAALILNALWLAAAFAVPAWLGKDHQLPNFAATPQSAPQSAVTTTNAAPGAANENAVTSTVVADEAKRLGSPQAILSRVGGVRYELYPGVFRGAASTLIDGAGNDYDRALLLHDMLAAANAGAVRYAFCTLTPQQADAAVAAAQKAYVAPNIASNADALASKASNPTLRAAYGKLADFWKSASGQEGQQATELAADVQKAGAQLAPPTAGDLRSIAADHVWVQLQTQGNWADFDPSAAQAKSGAAICSAGKSSDTLPDSAYDTVSASLRLESRDGARQSDASVASGSWRTADLADKTLVFAFAEPSGLSSPAPQPTGFRAYTPLIVAGMQTIAAPPIVVVPTLKGVNPAKAGSKGAKTGASQALQAFGSAPPAAPTPAPTPSGPVPVALRLDVTVAASNGSSTTAERPIFDRVSAADRASGQAATATLAAVSQLPFGTVWNVATNLGTGVAGAGGLTALDKTADDPVALTRALGMAHRSYYVTRRALFADGSAQNAPPIVAIRPGISFLGLAPQAAGVDPFGLAMDRGTESAAPLGGDGASALRWAVASVYAERLAIATPKMMAQSSRLDMLPFDDAIEMFYIARHSNIGPALVRTAADVPALPASPDAKARLVASIATGARAVVPSAVVPYGGANNYGWWILGNDGLVSDEMQSGMHQEMEEEGVQEEEAVEEAPAYRKSGFIVRCVGLGAGVLMAIAAASGGEGSSEIAEQLAEHIHAIYEANEQAEMMEAANECGH